MTMLLCPRTSFGTESASRPSCATLQPVEGGAGLRAGSKDTAQLGLEGEVVEQWEYLEIWQRRGVWWEDSLGRSGTLPITASNYPIAAGLLNELGEQGWELVAVVRAEDDMFFVQQRYVMKRKR